MKIRRLLKTAIPALLSMFVVACGGDMSDLQEYIAEVKQRPGGRIEPLPQIKPYETFRYRADNMRSPFMPDQREASSGKPTGPTPIENRNKEYLEQFPLDTLSMVGTLAREGKTYGLLQTADGLVHRVIPGNYVGQNDGRIVNIDDSGIQVEELVPDGIGGFFKRTAEIGID
ncbi:MAG: pilus assembly protein PilP [Gammaproteobacteria bacterium]